MFSFPYGGSGSGLAAPCGGRTVSAGVNRSKRETAESEAFQKEMCSVSLFSIVGQGEAKEKDITMVVREVKENKKQYLDLLLLADEQEDMIDRYLEKGTMYVLEDEGVRAECVVTDMIYLRREIQDQEQIPAAGKGACAPERGKGRFISVDKRR